MKSNGDAGEHETKSLHEQRAIDQPSYCTVIDGLRVYCTDTKSLISGLELQFRVKNPVNKYVELHRRMYYIRKSRL